MIGHAIAGLAAAVALAALLGNGATRASYGLPVWLGIVLGGEVMAMMREQTLLAYVSREVALSALNFVIAAELAREALGRLPRVVRRAQLALVAILALGAVGVLIGRAGTPTRDIYRTLALGHGVAAVALIAVGRVSARHYVPLHPVAEVAVLWLPAYLAAQVLLLGAATEASEGLSAAAGVTSTVAWVGLCGALALAAWSGRKWRPLEHLASRRWSRP